MDKCEQCKLNIGKQYELYMKMQYYSVITFFIGTTIGVGFGSFFGLISNKLF